MKRFLMKIAIFLILISFTVVGVYIWVGPQYSGKYTASINDKVERLKTLESPKIVLVGNSNLSFGMNSTLIENELEMPVVNLGLHGGLGNRFHENMVKEHIKEGDIIVVCHSYYSDDSYNINDPRLACITIENNFEYWKYISVEDIGKVLSCVPDYINNALELKYLEEGNMASDGPYSETAFNENGDVEYSRTENIYEFTEESVSVSPVGDKTIKSINELNELCKEKKATLLVALYPIANGEFTPEFEEFKKFEEELERNLDCPLISDIEDYMFDYSYFYDTALHLVDEGVEMRTQQLIEDIKNYENLIN